MKRFSSRPDPPRAAFTMIEILIVIVVISILIALLLPALGAARKSVNVARVRTEIASLESSLVHFKGKFGLDAPSQFTFYITEAGWNAHPKEKGIIRRMFPQFDFTMPAGSYPASWTTDRQMNSGECLVFFLGGIEDKGEMIGWYKNPAWPFSPPKQYTLPNGTFVDTTPNREPPLFKFDTGRLIDIDGNGSLEFADALPGRQVPYLYFCGYEGRGYQTSGATSELPMFLPGQDKLLLDVYRISKTAEDPGPVTQKLPGHNRTTYQIISAGYDGQFGLGGTWNEALPNAGLKDRYDHDNITNFSAGVLVK